MAQPQPGLDAPRPLRWWVLLAAAALGVYLCWLMVEPFLEVLLWAGVLVIVFHPLHRRIRKRVRSEHWAATLSCLIVICTILIPLALVTFALAREATRAATYIRANAAHWVAADSSWRARLETYHLDVDQIASPEIIAERLKLVGGAVAGKTLGFVGGVLGIVIEMFFILFTMYYFFRDTDRILAALRNAVPLDETQARDVFRRTEEVISASVYGVLVISAVQGLLGAVAFWVLRLPSPLTWGVVMFFCCMIPMAGAFIVWVPAAIYLFLTGHWIKAVMLALWGSLVIGMIDNLLRPILVGSRTRLHELLVFFSVLGGLQVFGVLGLILGPVVLAITLALVDVLRKAEGRPLLLAPSPSAAPAPAAVLPAPQEQPAQAQQQSA